MIIYNIKNKAFTLVELVITIVIIGILSTIGFMSFNGFNSDAKDTARHKDIKTISNLLEYEISLGKDLPEPDGFLVEESYDIGGETYNFKTGTFGTTKNDFFRGKMSKLPIDPNGQEYIYSLSDDGRFYILETTLNNGEKYRFSNLNDGGTGLLASAPKNSNSSGISSNGASLGSSGISSGNSGTSNSSAPQADRTPPEIIYSGQPINVSFGGHVNYNQIRARDNTTPSDRIQIFYDRNIVNVNQSGEYRVPFSAQDEFGNRSAPVEVIFKVGRKRTFPSFLKDGQVVAGSIIVEMQTGDQAPSITASDEIDGTLSVSANKNLLVNQAGQQIITYSATNTGNTTKTLRVTYNIRERSGGGTSSDLANAFSVEGCLKYLSLSNEVIITGFKDTCPTKDIEIPEFINGKPVNEIGAKAFYQKGITSLYAPHIKKIGDFSFQLSRLITLSLPEALVIGRDAFDNSTLLTSVDLPKVTTIGNNAFSETKLTSIELPKVITIGSSAFYMTELASIDLPEVITIGEQAFRDTKLTSINLPEVTTISKNSFWGTKLTSINLPKALVIGDSAFYNNLLLTSIELPEVITIGEYAFSGAKLTSINLLKVRTILGYAFSNTKLEEINFPQTLTTISFGAFINNNIQQITLPASLTNIGSNAFGNNPVYIINNESSLTEEQIKPAFNYSGVREYNGQCRENGQPCSTGN